MYRKWWWWWWWGGGGGGGGEENNHLKKYDGRTEGVLLGRVGNGSKEGKGAWEEGGIQGLKQVL